MSVTQLEAMRAQMIEAKAGLRKGRKKVFVPPEAVDFRHGRILAFDQSLTKTGWSLVVVDHDGIRVLAGGVLKPEVNPLLRSFEETYAKAHVLAEQMEDVLGKYHPINDIPSPDMVVHEMPAVRGYRIESSLMAGREVRRLCALLGQPVVMISRQAAYSLIVGAPSIEKSKGTEAVNRLVPNWRRSTDRWTQDVHDSVILALAWLYDRQEAPQ